LILNFILICILLKMSNKFLNQITTRSGKTYSIINDTVWVWYNVPCEGLVVSKLLLDKMYDKGNGTGFVNQFNKMWETRIYKQFLIDIKKRNKEKFNCEYICDKIKFKKNLKKLNNDILNLEICKINLKADFKKCIKLKKKNLKTDFKNKKNLLKTNKFLVIKKNSKKQPKLSHLKMNGTAYEFIKN